MRRPAVFFLIAVLLAAAVSAALAYLAPAATLTRLATWCLFHIIFEYFVFARNVDDGTFTPGGTLPAPGAGLFPRGGEFPST
jgi:hypothetical protein